jgi:hypothetical protein
MLKRVVKVLVAVAPIMLFSDNLWVGNGSVISIYSDLVNDKNFYTYGITKDVIQLRETPSQQKNVSFFKWTFKRKSCKNLKIYTNSNRQRVDIALGSWRSRSEDRLFKSVKLPFVVGSGNIKDSTLFKENNWLLMAVKLNDKTDGEGLFVECSSEPVTEVKPEEKLGSNITVDGYKWQGNGSIISDYFEPKNYKLNYKIDNLNIDWTFGAFKDIAKFHPNIDRQVVFFQWLKSRRCPNLKIDIFDNRDSAKLPDKKRYVKLVLKGTDIFGELNKTVKRVKLPYTLNGESRDYWTFLGIFSAEVFDKEYIVEARCTK